MRKSRIRFNTSPNILIEAKFLRIIVPAVAGLALFAGILAILSPDGAAPANDDWANAIELTDLNAWCSVDQAYTTVDATADESAGSCWNTGTNSNVWFKFQATAKDILIQMKTGGTEGSLQHGYIALWDELGNEITCAQYVNSNSDLTISDNSLTISDWYYISVDNHNGSSGYRGSFTLCIDSDIDYDWQEAAVELTDLTAWCSADAQYSTRWATADEAAGSCWNTGTNANRWFKFQATSKDIIIDMKTGGAEGTLQHGYIALWDDLGNEITCAQYVNSNSDLTISDNSLTIGEWYYISVDNHNGSSGYRGSFSLCIDSDLDYDWQEAAVELTDLTAWCSADAEYSTRWATADESAGSCWNTGTNANRWFKFQATSTDIIIDMKTGGTEGTLQHGYIALWDDLGNEVTCAQYVNSNSDLTISDNSLTIGEWYYVSVDNHNGSSGYRGSFSLCVDTELDYDWKEAAIELTDLTNWCSADAEYSTQWATADEAAGSCWNTSTNANRWFKFQATSNAITIDMKTGGAEGTLQHGFISLWDDLGNEITCARYVNSSSDLTISDNSLTIGEWYYVSVDNHNGSSGYRGSFSLCIDTELDYDWKEAAIELTDLTNWCSANAQYSTQWGTADETAGSCWNTGTNANRWFKFQATSKDIIIDMKTGGTEGTLQHGFIALWDDLGNEITCARYVNSNSDLTISDNSLTIGEWYYISVDNHNGSSGYRGSFTLCIDSDLDYDWQEAAVELTDLTDWCSADAEYSTRWATADEAAGSCWNTGTNANRWFKFQATSTDIIIDMKTGGTEGTLQYGYIALWDDLGNEITCAQYVNSNSDLTISDNSLTIGEWYYISVDNHNGSSGYRGSFSLCIDSDIDYDWREAAIEFTDLDSWTSPLEAYSTRWATADETKGSCWNTGTNANRWFTFIAPGSNVEVTLLTGGSEGTLRYGYISLWDNLGSEITCNQYTSSASDVSIATGVLTPGQRYYISVDNHNASSGYRGTFSMYINSNIIFPVGFVNFGGEVDETGTHLRWVTATELNNQFFTVERSENGLYFDAIGTVDGAGTSTSPLEYEFNDQGFNGSAMFYRIKQTDFNGTYSYSNTIQLSLPGSLIKSVLPNPFTDHLSISYTLSSPSQIELSLIDMKGSVVDQTTVTASAGDNEFNWRTNQQLSAGIYLLKIAAPGQGFQYKKVIKQ